jgi:acyl carrier protein
MPLREDRGLADMNDVDTKVRNFIKDNFLFREDRGGLSDSESLLEAGLIDSTGILELVAFLESEFAIQMADAEIVPANLDSIKAIVAYVQGKMVKPAAA